MKHQRNGSSTDTTVNAEARQRQRQLTANRVRQHRARQQEASLVQLQQSERVVQLGYDPIIRPTISQLGLRVQGLTLAMDSNNIPTTESTQAVNEHHSLYTRSASDNPESHSTSHREPEENSIDLAQFFRQQPRAINTRSTPSPGSPSLDPQTGPSNRPILPGSKDFLGHCHNEDDNEDHDDTAFPTLSDGLDKIEIPSTVAPDLGPPPPSNPAGPARVSSPEQQTSPANLHESDNDSNFNPLPERLPGPSGYTEPDATSTVAEQLVRLFLYGIQGCTEEQHQTELAHHMNEYGNNHHGLNDLFHDPQFPSVLHRHDMLTTQQVVERSAVAPVQWREMFCGVSDRSQNGRPLQVCLHQEQTRACEPDVAFDVDSFLGFTNSLAFAKKGLWYQPAPQMRQNITTDVHITTSTFQDGVDADGEWSSRPTAAMLRDIPHFLLGRVEGAHDITVHVLFPHLSSHGDKFQALTSAQYSRWFDHVFHPAVYTHCRAHYSQHLPASFRQAFANSKARQVEQRLIETSSYQAQQALGYHLQPHMLAAIWEDVLDHSATVPGLQDFRDPQLFFSAKGTKLTFKSTPAQPSFLDVLDRFELFVADLIDMELVDADRFFVDIAKEVCPSVSVAPGQALAFDEQPQTYLWKRCCQEQHARHIYDERPPAKGGRGQSYYTQNMLRDAGSLTSVPPKRSPLYQGGVRYFQLYGSVKEVWDAAKSMPFDNDGLEELALDPQIRDAARHISGGRARSAHIVEQAYTASKKRTHHAIRDSMRKSFGIREEYRVSWRLYCNIQSQLRRSGLAEAARPPADCPSHAWAIRTDVFLGFLWRSVDKFATGFEYVRARARSDLVTWEQTKMMAMFLRCLRYVLGGQGLPRESALWWSRRERVVGEEERVWYGLGFCNTLPRYGYCWLEPRMDWAALEFAPDITDRVLFGNSTLRGRYLRRGGHVQDLFALSRQLDLAVQWLRAHRRHPRIPQRLVFWAVYICLQQFRIDVLTSVASAIRPERRRDALLGQEPFSYDYFDEIFSDGVYLTSGNRSEVKEALQLRDCLFKYGPTDAWRRDHWENRPFRKLYARADTALSMHLGVDSAITLAFRRRFTRCLFAYHWLLPHPAGGMLLQTTKEGRRMWFSIRRTGPNAHGTTASRHEGWEWARKDWQTGRPTALPDFTQWDKAAWEAWMSEELTRPRDAGADTGVAQG